MSIHFAPSILTSFPYQCFDTEKVYNLFSLSARILHFLFGAFLHFITGADNRAPDCIIVKTVRDVGRSAEAIGEAVEKLYDYSKQLQYDLREIPARTKDFFKTLFKVPSTFVGDPISLDQSGDVTEG